MDSGAVFRPSEKDAARCRIAKKRGGQKHVNFQFSRFPLGWWLWKLPCTATDVTRPRPVTRRLRNESNQGDEVLHVNAGIQPSVQHEQSSSINRASNNVEKNRAMRTSSTTDPGLAAAGAAWTARVVRAPRRHQTHPARRLSNRGFRSIHSTGKSSQNTL